MKSLASLDSLKAQQRGQATLELALLLPVLLLMVLFCVQVGFLVRDQIMVVHAARSAARAVAAVNDPSRALPAALASAQLDPLRLKVSVVGAASRGEDVEVGLEYRSPVLFAPFRLITEEFPLSEKVVMRAE